MPAGVNFDRPIVQQRSLNEFIYTIVMNMSNQQRQALPDHLRRYTSTQKRFQKFIEKSSLEQKRELLSYSDLATFFVIAPMGITGNMETMELIRKFKDNNVQDGLRKAVKSNMYVSSDTDLAFALGRMSSTLNGIPYIQNLELKRAAEATRKWSKKLPKSDDVEDESIELIMRVLLWSGVNWEQSISAVGLERDNLKILFYLYMRRNNYVDKDAIESFFSGIIQVGKMRSNYVVLRQAMLIQNQYVDGKTGYRITAKGIRVCNQFRDRILKSINF